MACGKNAPNCDHVRCDRRVNTILTVKTRSFKVLLFNELIPNYLGLLCTVHMLNESPPFKEKQVKAVKSS